MRPQLFKFRFLLKTVAPSSVIIMNKGSSMEGWNSGTALVLVIWIISVPGEYVK